jgi:hypothetical protein
MLHVKVNSQSEVLGYNVGTFAEFEARHLGDPAWKFVDLPKATKESDSKAFLLAPLSFKVTSDGRLRKK